MAKRNQKKINQPESINLEAIDEKEIDKLLAEKSLHEFVKQAWNIIEPGLEFKDNWHIRAICDHLEAVTAGKISNLLINVPPGTMKSLLTNVFWPAWVWTKNPEKRFMFSSYAEELSMRDSVKCRNIILSEWYQDRWPTFISDDQNTKGKFQNKKGGWRMVGSITGKGIGEHPDYNCLKGDVELTCRDGNKTIKEIVEAAKEVEILSFNHTSSKCEWKRAYQFKKSKGAPCLLITTSMGRKFICTTGHPIFVIGKGYKEARLLQIGDAVFSELHNLRGENEPQPNMGKAKILFSKMSRTIFKRRKPSSIQGSIQVHVQDLLKGNNTSEVRAEKKPTVLLSPMSSERNDKAQKKQAMQKLRECNSWIAKLFKTQNVLFKKMRKLGASDNDGRKIKPKLFSRESIGTISKWIFYGSKEGQSKGRKMQNVWNSKSSNDQSIGRSSHKLHQDRQPSGKLNLFLQMVSREIAWKTKKQKNVAVETIKIIENAGTPDFVYNVAVEGNHNYFANGVLTHNCADDPHNVQTSESEKERNNVINWLDGTFSTRGVSRGVKKVLIMQRLHFKDASGHLLSKGGWVHICLPMRYEAPTLIDQPDGTKKLTPRMPKTPLGFIDPRKKEGELLWPELFSEKIIEEMENNLGLYHTAGQLQQRPAPRGGGMFLRVWFTIVTQVPKLEAIVRYWDKSGTEGGDGAKTSGVLMARYRDETEIIQSRKTKYIILDVISFRKTAAGREAIIKQTAELDKLKWGYVEIWVEQEPGSGGKESAEGTISNLNGYTCKAEKVTGSKEVRADPMASQASVGKISLLQGEWNQKFLEEIENFPVGVLKDQVDGSSGAFNKLNMPTGAIQSAGDIVTLPEWNAENDNESNLTLEKSTETDVEIE